MNEAIETNAVVVREPAAVATTPPVQLSQRDIDTLVAVGAIPKGTPPDVIRFFSQACGETRLSPFKRQVHLIKRWSNQGDRYTVQTGIDGYRAVANRTGLYAGNDEYKFDEGVGEYEMIKSGRQKPITATSTVYKAIGGIRCPFSATARWEEYYPGEKQGFMWDKMPFLMLGKCAEALALRKAFPEELSGVYTDEEMSQADAPKTAQPLAQPKKAAPAPAKASTEHFKSVEEFLEHAKKELLAKVKADNLLFPAWVYAVEAGLILNNEKLDAATTTKLFPSAIDLPMDKAKDLAREHFLSFLKSATQTGKHLIAHPSGEHDKLFDAVYGTQSEPEPLEPQGADEWFWDVIISVPRKGQRKAEYEQNPDTIRSLYVSGKNGNDEDRQRLFGLAHKMDLKPREYNGKTYPPSEADKQTRKALDAFLEYEKSKAEAGCADARAATEPPPEDDVPFL